MSKLRADNACIAPVVATWCVLVVGPSGAEDASFSEQEFKLGNHVEVLPEIDPNPGIPRSVVADPRFIVASTCAILSLTPV
jgi:hypothetical protein